MILKLVAVLILLLGVGIIAFASRIGMFIFNINENIKKSIAGGSITKFLHNRWWLSWATIEHHIGPLSDIWLIRIIGMSLVACAIILFTFVISS